MRILRKATKWVFFALVPPARRLRDQRDAFCAERNALLTEIQRLECNPARAKK